MSLALLSQERCGESWVVLLWGGGGSLAPPGTSTCSGASAELRCVDGGGGFTVRAAAPGIV